MSSDYREGYQVGLKDGKRLGVEEYKKELADSLKNAMPQPLMVVNDVPTLRDKFAMAVLPEAYRGWITAGNGEKGVAAMAYKMADAMLEKRNKRG